MCCACSVIQRCLANFITTVSYDRKIFTALATFFVDIEPEFFFPEKIFFVPVYKFSLCPEAFSGVKISLAVCAIQVFSA
jgi:hypothetical protein